MAWFQRLQKVKGIGLATTGAVCGGSLVYYFGLSSPANASSPFYSNAEVPQTNGEDHRKTFPEPCKTISIPWDSNWDRKSGTDVTELKCNRIDNKSGSNVGIKDSSTTNTNEFQPKKKPKASRHIILIRHGQYNLKREKDEDRTLTELGREQAAITGERLKTLNIKFDKIIHSNMTRATETAELVSRSLPHVPMSTCSMLREGAPCHPEPLSTSWKIDDWEVYQEGARIEAAFRKYFYRADVSQEKDSYELIICHGNVIRYFACRALQFPPDGWLRMSIGHCGLTWVTIRPNGRVSLKSLGDTGHLPPDLLTFS